MNRATNDFTRTEGEVLAPFRRGGFHAVSLLHHLPEERFVELGQTWNDRMLGPAAFVEVLSPFVQQAGFFDKQGRKIKEKWLQAGWESEVFASSHHLGDYFVESQGSSHHATGRSELQKYLRDVFAFIDSKRTYALSWEDFTLFLVDGVSSAAAGRGAVEKQQETASSASTMQYRFVGSLTPSPPIQQASELNSLNPTINQHGPIKQVEADRWLFYRRLCYLEDMDLVMGVTKHTVQYFSATVMSTGNTLPTKKDLEIKVMNGGISSAEYIPNVKSTVIASYDRVPMRIWLHHFNGEPREVLTGPFPIPDPSVVTTLRFAHGRLFGGTRKGTVFALNITDDGLLKVGARKVFSLKGHTDAVTSYCVLRHSNTMISTSLDSTIRVFDAAAGASQDKTIVARGHQHGVLTADFSEEVGVLLSGGFDDSLCVWADNLWQKPVFQLFDTAMPLRKVIGIKAIPSSPYVAVADHEGGLRIFDLRQRLVVLNESVLDEANFARGLIKRDQLRTEPSDTGVNPDAELSDSLFASFEFLGARHRELLFGGSRIFRFGMASGYNEEPTLTYDPVTPVIACHGLRDGVLTATNSELTLWSASTGRTDLRRPLKGSPITNEAVTIVLIMPHTDDKVVMLGFASGCVAIYNIETSMIVKDYNSHETPICALALHPHRGHLVTCSTDGRHCVWKDSVLRGTGDFDLPDAKPDDARRMFPAQQNVVEGEPLLAKFVCQTVEILVIVSRSTISVFTFNIEFNRWVFKEEARVQGVSDLQSATLVTLRETDTSLVLLSVDDEGRIVFVSMDFATLTFSRPQIVFNIPVATKLWAPQPALPLASALRRVAFSATLEHLFYTGDELGRVICWGYGPLIKSLFGLCADNVCSPYTLSQVHDGQVKQLICVSNPFHGIISCGAENRVVLSSWDGSPLARLEQGPIVNRQWNLRPVPHYNHQQFAVRWRWLLVLRFSVAEARKVKAAREQLGLASDMKLADVIEEARAAEARAIALKVEEEEMRRKFKVVGCVKRSVELPLDAWGNPVKYYEMKKVRLPRQLMPLSTPPRREVGPKDRGLSEASKAKYPTPNSNIIALGRRNPEHVPSPSRLPPLSLPSPGAVDQREMTEPPCRSPKRQQRVMMSSLQKQHQTSSSALHIVGQKKDPNA